MSTKRKLLIGVAVLGACSFAGGAYAATNDSSPRQAFLNDVAGRLDVTPQRLRSAIEGALFDQLQDAVRAGKLTQAQANAIEQRIRQNGTVPFGFPFGHHMFGFEHLRGGPLRAAAAYIGISEVQLFAQLRDGKSLAQIAAAHGKTAAGLESALVADLRAKLDRAVAVGRITQSEEQRLLSRLESAVGNLINRTPRFGRWLGPEPRLGFGPTAPLGFGPPPPPRFMPPPPGA